ncbi:hypothetical protein F908_00967 [Acinetobacter sp. NIPH 284]|nr:hypothetical protein F908_00967 [Acinetobacter sp. NIPH 284]
MNLFEDLEQRNSEYINAIDALNLLADKTNNSLPNICKFLLLRSFNFNIETFSKGYLDEIYHCDYQGGLHDGMYEVTTDILERGLGNFECKQTDFNLIYDKEELERYYWLRSDFFSFQPIQELNISPSDYTDYLTGKALLWLSKQEKDTFIEDMQELNKDELKPKTFEPPLFYLNDTFSLIEASCLLSGDSPIQINRCFNDTNFDQNHHNFNEAYNFINSAIWAGSLPENLIPSHQLKLYLQSKGKIIEGFNDNLPIQEPIGCGNPTIQQNEPNIENLNAEISRLRKEIEDRDKTAIELQNRISELESQLSDALSKNIPSINNELHPSLDPAHKNHAPELLLAVQAWEAKYLENEYPHQEHTPAITNILKNKNVTQVNLVKRICAITNPKK